MSKVDIYHTKTHVKFGTMKGKIWVSDDFDAPLPDDILDAFEGKNESSDPPDEKAERG